MVEEYMLRVHEAVAVVKHTYPDQVPNEGEGLRRDCFYYGLIPSLRDALSFTWLTYWRENKQIPASTLSTIWPRNWRHAHQPHNATKGGTLTHDPHKGYKKYSTPVGHAATVEVDLFPPDPDLVESAPPEARSHRRIVPEDDTSYESLPKAGMSVFHVWGHRTLHEGLSTLQSFPCMAQGTFKLPGGRPEEQDACPKEQPLELATRITSYPEVAQALETGPMTRWVGLETLVDVMLEGCEVLALADSGSQVNMMMPEFVQEWGYPVLPLDGLVNYPLHLVGLGGRHTCPLGFVIVRLQVKEVAGYDEDIVFLVVPDGSAFGKRVPLVIGTCTLA